MRIPTLPAYSTLCKPVPDMAGLLVVAWWLLPGGWWLLPGGCCLVAVAWWLVAVAWWLVAGGCCLVAVAWWLVAVPGGCCLVAVACCCLVAGVTGWGSRHRRQRCRVRRHQHLLKDQVHELRNVLWLHVLSIHGRPCPWQSICMLAKGRLLCSIPHQLHVAEDGHHRVERVGAQLALILAVASLCEALIASTLGGQHSPLAARVSQAPYKRLNTSINSIRVGYLTQVSVDGEGVMEGYVSPLRRRSVPAAVPYRPSTQLGRPRGGGTGRTM
eukprot:364849-Chlamydomonas_euryale.AAC.4